MLPECFMCMADIMLEDVECENEHLENRQKNSDVITKKQRVCLECPEQEECYKFSMMRSIANMEYTIMDIAYDLSDDKNRNKRESLKSKNLKKKEEKRN